MPSCLTCGYLNPENARFCTECGSAMAGPTVEPTAKPPTIPQDAPHKGLSVPLKIAMVGTVLVVMLAVGVIATISFNPNQASTTAPPPPPPPEATPTWHTVSTFHNTTATNNGNSPTNTTTQTFGIKGSKFRLLWTYSTHFPEAPLFEVSIYSIGGELVLGFCEVGYETSIIAPGCQVQYGYHNQGTKIVARNGTFYLNVQTAVVATWSITVEDYY